MKVLIVGGTFDNDGGKPSFFVQEISKAFFEFETMTINGGSLDMIAMTNFSIYDIIVWMPNIDNSEDKILPHIKKINPRCTLISSKRVIEKEYTEFDVIGRLLKSHSNLGIMITKDEEYNFQLLDPLGNSYANTGNINELAENLVERIWEIRGMERVGSMSVGERRDFQVDNEFLKFIRYSAEEFTKYVNAINPNRMLGNASTRCMYGFPAQKTTETIIVTQRNIDKELIDNGGFVEVETTENIVKYYGDTKPSVDTPIQIKLFNHYDKIKYMVHGHVYIDGAPFTRNKIPCGFIEEFDEIVELFPDKDQGSFAVNLLGHGCLLMADSVEDLWKMGQYKSRPFPED